MTQHQNLSTKDVLRSKKGMVQALGVTMLIMSLLTAAGVVVANYAINSKQAGELKTLSAEIVNRAERYTGSLNADLVTVQVPTTTRECSVAPALCTTIIDETTSADGTQKVLRIEGETVSGFGQTLTKDVTLVSSEVTHVTSIDERGNQVWALSDEGLRYRMWGLATGKPSDVKPEDIAGPGAASYWVAISDRAGIDNEGALWVFGANERGQAGVGAASAEPVKPTKIDAPGVTFRSVVTLDDRGYAIDSRGNAWLWGLNTGNQLGMGGAVVLEPTTFPGFRVVDVVGGKQSSIGLLTNGQLGFAGTPPAGLTIGSEKFKAIAAAVDGGFATIDLAGKLNVLGAPYSFTPGSEKFAQVALGTTTGYAISTGGDLFSWGTGANGQLGLGATTSVTTPTQVKPGTKFVAVSATKTAAFAVDTSGKLYYFGKSPSGVVGGTDLPQVNVPTQLLTGTTFRDIEASNDGTAVALLDTRGHVYGIGTATPGLWPMNYLGANDSPIRMPLPEGFTTNTWE